MRLPRLLSPLFLLLALVATGARAENAPAKITVLTWEAFISPKVLTTIKNRENLAVNLIEFTTPEQREQILREKQGQIDIVVADTVHTDIYKRRGLLQKLDAARVPAMRHVLSHWRTQEEYAVPYLWGHTGIAWRTDKVSKPITSYAELFALAKANPGKVSVLDDPHEALRAALYAFGKPPYTMNTPAGVKHADGLFQAQRRNLRIVGSEVSEDSPWMDGTLIAGQAFNGDIAFLRDNLKAPLAFAIPSPGCMIFHEQLTMLAGSKNKDAAYRFLALITEPLYGARNAEQVRFAPSNPLTVAQLTEAFREDSVIRPTFEGLDGCYFYGPFDAETQKALDAVKLQ